MKNLELYRGWFKTHTEESEHKSLDACFDKFHEMRGEALVSVALNRYQDTLTKSVHFHPIFETARDMFIMGILLGATVESGEAPLFIRAISEWLEDYKKSGADKVISFADVIARAEAKGYANERH